MEWIIIISVYFLTSVISAINSELDVFEEIKEISLPHSYGLYFILYGGTKSAFTGQMLLDNWRKNIWSSYLHYITCHFKD